MQPTQFSPVADLSAIDITALEQAPASPATRNLAAAFAELLGESIDTSGPVPVAGGERLPESGNILPVPPATPADTLIDPEEIVASLERELEGLSHEQVTLPDPQQEPQAPDGDVDIHVVTETLKPVSDLAPPAPIVTPPQSVDTPDIVDEASGKEPAERLLPPAAPLPVELPKSNTPPAPPVVAVPSGAAEIRQALPREERPVRPPSAPATPSVPAGGVNANNGTLDVVHTRTLGDEAIQNLKGTKTPRTSTPLQSSATTAAVVESAKPSPVVTNTTAEPAPGLSAPPAPTATTVTPVSTEATITTSSLASLSPRQASPAPQPTAAPPTTLAASIELPVQESGWDKMISERVVMMASNKLQNAEIRLTPAELGPLRVQLAIEDGAAKVGFAAQHAMTRDAIEQALPRLREMLAETGLTLTEASVGDEGLDYSASRDGDRQAPSAAGSDGDAAADGDAVVDAPEVLRTSDGLVDTFV